jgi:hypothetical protein
MVERGRLETLRECMMSGGTPAAMAVAASIGEQESTEQVNRIVSSMHRAGPLYPPIADVSLRRSEPPLRAMCGRLQVGKENLHVAGLVGAAMCSAFECGSHDRWP